MGIRQISDLPQNTAPDDTDQFVTRQISTDKQLLMDDLAKHVWRDSLASPTSEIVTESTTISATDPQDKIINVNNGFWDATITFPTATEDNVGIRIAVYKQDTDTGIVKITGDITGDAVYLRSQEVAIFMGSQTETGPTVYQWVQIKERNLSNPTYQDDALGSLLQPPNTDLWEFDSPSFSNDKGLLPAHITNISFLPSTDSNALFAKRGVMYINEGCMVYSYSLANQGYLGIRVKPNFSYTTSENQFIIDTRSMAGNNDNAIFLYYAETADKWSVIMSDDASNRYVLQGTTITSDVSLQQWTTFFVNWDINETANGDVNFYINGVLVPTKTLFGTGISAADFTTKNELALCGNSDISIGITTYMTQLLIGSVYSTDTSNHEGTGDLPYFADNRIAGKNHGYMLDEFGNIGAASLSCPKILNDVEVTGFLQYKSKRITSLNYIHGNAIIAADIFDIIAPFVPNIGDQILLTGSSDSGVIFIYSRAHRTTATIIDLYGTSNGTVAVSSIVDGGGATKNISIAW